MPFARTWTEELVAEWLQLEDFLVELNLPAGSAGRGGRYEADVVGARIRNGKLEIRHCEVTYGLIGNPQEQTDRYAKKFAAPIREHISQVFSRRLGLQSEEKMYQPYVIAGGYSAEMGRLLKEKVPDVTLLKLGEFIRKEVLDSMNSWGERGKSAKGNSPTLSQSMWLLSMLYTMKLNDPRERNA